MCDEVECSQYRLREEQEAGNDGSGCLHRAPSIFFCPWQVLLPLATVHITPQPDQEKLFAQLLERRLETLEDLILVSFGIYA